MENDEKKKGLLNAVGSAISKAGELGVKAGGAIKGFAERWLKAFVKEPKQQLMVWQKEPSLRLME